MKKIFLTSLFAILPSALMAAGTYYTGGYQSPQQNYARPTYTNANAAVARPVAAPSYATSGYSRYGNQVVAQNITQQQVVRPAAAPSGTSADNGFYLNAGASYQNATWQFDMNEAGSKLHYDNINWYVFDVDAGYRFDSFEIYAGAKIGMQGSDSTMVDDDITNGGYFITEWVDSSGGHIGDQIGHALSVGTSGGGSMFGYNLGVGMTDLFTLGNLKITPSVGWRNLSYTLETSGNYGLSVDTANCFHLDGETQCDPAIVVVYDDGSQQILWRDDITGRMEIGDNAAWVDTGGTYQYSQPDISHSYEVEWAGPYIALDARYDINQYNSVDAHVELGFPGYNATGDQPYRFDWAHPKSVEDSASMFSGFNIGLGLNWNTAVSNNVMLTVGMTYDYYTVGGAQAKTFLNGGYYDDLYGMAQEIIDNGASDPSDVAAAEDLQLNIDDLKAACPGWVCTTENEIESFYKSLGVRVGFAARF